MTLLSSLSTFGVRYHSAQLAAFSALGRSLYKNSKWFLAIGLALCAILMAGWYRVSENAVVANLWTEKGSELNSEISFYNKYFGGIGRDASFILVARGPEGFGSVEALDAALECTLTRG